MLLRGTVSIYINNTIADGDDELEVSGQTGQLNDTYPIPENELDRSKFGNLIAHFGYYNTQPTI